MKDFLKNKDNLIIAIYNWKVVHKTKKKEFKHLVKNYETN